MKFNNHTDRNEISETLFAIMNIAHSEYHLLESMMLNIDKVNDELKNNLNKIREIRVKLMTKLQEENPAIKGIWCTFKHLLLTEFHLFEIYEKTYDIEILKMSQDVHLIIDELLSMDELNELEGCPRCEEDE